MTAPHAAGVVALMWEKTLLLNLPGCEDGSATLRAEAALVGDGEREGILSAPRAISWHWRRHVDVLGPGVLSSRGRSAQNDRTGA